MMAYKTHSDRSGGITVDTKTNRIRIERMRRGLTLEELGEKVGITKSSMSALENGKSAPRPSTAKKLCDVLGLEYETLFMISEREEARS
jgi:transcriptional regulator with XRE-family HTH domain